MKEIIKLTCTSCGANLTIDEEREHLYCQYCGAKLVLDNDNEHVYRHIDVADIKRAETEQLVKLKELEIKEKEKEYKRKMVKVKIIISLFLAAIGVVMMILGNTMGTESGDSNSGWYMVSMIGLFPFMGAAYIWLFSIGDKKE